LPRSYPTNGDNDRVLQTPRWSIQRHLRLRQTSVSVVGRRLHRFPDAAIVVDDHAVVLGKLSDLIDFPDSPSQPFRGKTIGRPCAGFRNKIQLVYDLTLGIQIPRCACRLFAIISCHKPPYVCSKGATAGCASSQTITDGLTENCLSAVMSSYTHGDRIRRFVSRFGSRTRSAS